MNRLSSILPERCRPQDPDRSLNVSDQWHFDVCEQRSNSVWRNVSLRHLRTADERLTPLDCWLWSVQQGVWDDSACVALLDDSEREQMRRRPAAQQQHYARHHAALRVLLAQGVREQDAQLEIAQDAYGKPYLPAYPELHFNLSHSGPFGGLTLGSRVIGFDIELPGSADYDQLAQRFFPFEAQQLQHSNSTQANQEHFARLWTAKEAYLKAIGRGLSLRLNSFRLRTDTEGRAIDLLDAGLTANRHRCRFYVLPERPDWDYVGTLVALSEAGD